MDDLKESLANLAKVRFDNIATQFDEIISSVTHAQDLINKMIETTEEQGYIVGTTYYNALIDMENNHLGKLQREYDTLKQAQQEAVDKGLINEGSQAWWEMQNQIDEVESSIYDARKALLEYANAIRQVEWDLFDRKQSYISLIKDETSWLEDLLRTEHKITDETTGRLNQYGKSIGALQVINYQTNMEQARKYAEELNNINAQLAGDPYNTKLIDRRNELLRLQRESIKAAEDEKVAIKNLIKESYDAMLEVLQNLINKRKEALQAEKDLYDYQKTVKNKADNISSLKKQIMAISADDSEETKARMQKLVKDLKSAQEDLEDTEYNKWLSDQQRMLDDLYDNAEELLNARLDNIDGLLQDMINTTNQNSAEINSTIKSEAAEVGYTITNETTNILHGIETTNDVIWTVGNTVYTISTLVDNMRYNSEVTANNLATLIQNGIIHHSDDVNNANFIIQAINNAAATIGNAVGMAVSNASASAQNSGGSSGTSGSSGGGTWNGDYTDGSSAQNETEYKRITGEIERLTAQKNSLMVRFNELDAIISRGQTPTTSNNVWQAKLAEYSSLKNQINGIDRTIQELYNKRKLIYGSYAKGGTIGKAIRSTGEDGIILARTGEEVLSLEKIKGMKDVLQAFEPFAMAVTKLPQVSNNHSNVANEINVSFTLPNVTNYEQFIQTARTDSRFEKIIQQMTFGNALGQNTLKKYTM